MSKKYYQKSKEYIYKIFIESGNESGLKHFIRTVYWVKKLKSGADDALLIAAIAHDCERAFRKPNYWKIFRDSPLGFRDEKHMKHHQETGANVVARFLEKEGADDNLIHKVRSLVEKHEMGGSKEQNILKDADSISFFENNRELFLGKQIERVGRKRVRAKFDWMYNRITSPTAKKIAKKWYQEGIDKLKNNVQKP